MERVVGAVVTFLAEKDEAVGPHGLEVVDRQVLLRSTDQAGREVNLACLDESGGPTAEPVASFLAVGGSFASSFQTDGTCGTIHGNHCAPPFKVRLARAGLVLLHLLGSPCA